MGDGRYDKPAQNEGLPLPSYEEATASRWTSGGHVGAGEISNDAERQGLLGRDGRTSAELDDRGRSRFAGGSLSRSASLDSDLYLRSSDEEHEGLRREISQMDIIEPESQETAARRFNFTSNFSKHIVSITNTLSSINLPFRFRTSFSESLRNYLPTCDTSKAGIVARFIGLLLIMSLIYALVVFKVFPSGSGAFGGPMFDPESVRAYAQGNMDARRIEGYVRSLAGYDHVAGTEGDFSMLQIVEAAFKKGELDYYERTGFDVYINYPRPGGRRVAIIDPPNMAWEASIEENSVYENPTPQQQQTLVFHGHSRAGNATGPLIYANRGSLEDLNLLTGYGVDLHGAILLIRSDGSSNSGLIVKAAEIAGAIGCILFTPPEGDSFPDDSVRRDSVSLTNWIVGDPLTPGVSSYSAKDRISADGNPGLVNIPSIPLSWKDARVLLASLKDHGRKLPESWTFETSEISEWWSGDGKSPVVNLENEQDEVTQQKVYNLVGKIVGTEQGEKTLYVGAHRDAWCFGAAESGSGTAILMEVMGVFSELRKLGWRPLRTIYFASWDAKEYNLMGSTEYVESEMEPLRKDGVGYVNLDVGVSGSRFQAEGSPLFQRALLRVLDRTSDSAANQTLREMWDADGNTLNGVHTGKDYIPFQDMAGMSSIDLGFGGASFPQHSCYDTVEWLSQIDPGFERHKVLAQVLALLILEISDRYIIPYDFPAYANVLQSLVADLESFAVSKSMSLDFVSLKTAADDFATNTGNFQEFEDNWTNTIYSSGGFESNALGIHRMLHNARMANFDRHILDLDEGGGLHGRDQYKHIVYGPQAWTDDIPFFPAVRDSINEGQRETAQRELDKVAEILAKASHQLMT